MIKTPWLSKWLFFIAVLAVFNTLQSYYDNIFVNRQLLYSEQPEQMTALGSRLFACWTLLSAFILAMTSYQVHLLYLTRNYMIETSLRKGGADRNSLPYTTAAAVSYWYDLTLWGWFITFAHFFSEIYYFQTATWNATTMLPILLSSITFFWMFLARSFYLYDDRGHHSD
jgi:Erg28 like protein